MEDKIQEIMELVDDVLGCDSAGYRFECKRQIQSKLRELVERCSVREPLRDKRIGEIAVECDEGQDGMEFLLSFARAIECTHNITNTTKG